MKADYLSYQHATQRSLLGLAIQLGLGLVLLVFSIYAGDHAAGTAAFYMLLGVPLWLALAVVFDQHRRERIEAVEAEAFAASDAAASSVFESQADELRVAHKRLRWMYRFFIPGVSLGIAAMLILIGLWRFNGGQAGLGDRWEAAKDVRESHRGWAIALSLGTAFVGFLFARYMSGMAKQKVWEALRAGAAYAAGTALLGLVIAVGHFIDIPGTDLVLKYLLVVYPVFMIALGAEMVLNFLLDLYRPRKPGEFPRPAFESRVLGFLAAPDQIAESIGEAINYQFGYDVTDSWVYRLLARSVLRVLVPVAVVVLWGMTALTVVRPHERGMVLRFGRLVKVLEPGLHLKWPWPIESVEVPQYTERDAQGKVTLASQTVTGVRALNIGAPPPGSDKPILWTNEHAQEVLFLVQPGAASTPGAAAGARGRIDLAAVAAEVPLHYTIADVQAYEMLAPPEQRDQLLKAVAQRAVMQTLASLTVGDLLGENRMQAQEVLRQAIAREFAALNPREPGKPFIDVLFVGISGVHPPRETARSFEQVVEAGQKYVAKTTGARGEAIRTLTASVGSRELADSIIGELDSLEEMERAKTTNEAQQEQKQKVVTLIEKAGGRSAALILEASAERWTKHMRERQRLADYQGQVGTYRAAPAVYRAGLYLEAMAAAVSKARLYVTDGKAKLDLRFDFQDKDSATATLGDQNPLVPQP